MPCNVRSRQTLCPPHTPQMTDKLKSTRDHNAALRDAVTFTGDALNGDTSELFAWTWEDIGNALVVVILILGVAMLAWSAFTKWRSEQVSGIFYTPPSVLGERSTTTCVHLMGAHPRRGSVGC